MTEKQNDLIRRGIAIQALHVDLRSDDDTRRASDWAINRIGAVPPVLEGHNARNLVSAIESFMHADAIASIVQIIGIARLNNQELTKAQLEFMRLHADVVKAFDAYREGLRSTVVADHQNGPCSNCAGSGKAFHFPRLGPLDTKSNCPSCRPSKTT